VQSNGLTKQRLIQSLVVIIAAGVFFLPRTALADAAVVSPEPLKPTTLRLDLSLPDIYTTPPPAGMQNDLSVTRDIYYGSLNGLKTHKIYPFGYQQVKVDKSMRVRGWEVKDQFYVGQTRVGKEWGLGMMMTQGNFAYGLNNKGIGMTFSGENSIYRINMQEISLEIDF